VSVLPPDPPFPFFLHDLCALRVLAFLALPGVVLKGRRIHDRDAASTRLRYFFLVHKLPGQSAGAGIVFSRIASSVIRFFFALRCRRRLTAHHPGPLYSECFCPPISSASASPSRRCSQSKYLDSSGGSRVCPRTGLQESHVLFHKIDSAPLHTHCLPSFTPPPPHNLSTYGFSPLPHSRPFLRSSMFGRI